MTRHLDFWDIQGNIVRSYGRYGFPFARHYFYHFRSASEGRAFLAKIIPLVTTAAGWRSDKDPENPLERPLVTLNVGFSWLGLKSLGLPTLTLALMPEEFIDGMARRAMLLGDTGQSSISNWDQIWQNSANSPDAAVHMWLSLNSQMDEGGNAVPQLEELTDTLARYVDQSLGQVVLLTGHGKSGPEYQQGGLHIVQGPNGKPVISPKEHFGMVDGIGDPIFEGQFGAGADEALVAGRGKLMPDQTWSAIATGEFLLGHVDESQETVTVVQPTEFIRNGTFLVYRKLQENVDMFANYLGEQAAKFAAARGISLGEAQETLKAKIVGRWSNGAPLSTAPTYQDMLDFSKRWAGIFEIIGKSGKRTSDENKMVREFKLAMSNFKFLDDKLGAKCPLAAHIRRGNPRDMLDPMQDSKNPKDRGGSSLVNRRRILRRGIPYGKFADDKYAGDDERGIVFIAICSDIERQFEFVQQQWMNYGMDMNIGNEGCPLVGLHDGTSRFVVPADPESGNLPFFLGQIPQFVSTKGGEYFFLPSLTSLRMIASGSVDAT